MKAAAKGAKKKASGQKTARLEIRLTPKQRRLFEKAAARLGSTLTDFAKNALEAEANSVLGTSPVIRLNVEETLNFYRMMDAPVEPAKELIDAMRAAKSMKSA